MDNLNEKIDGLKPCPFCGGKGMIYEDKNSYYHILCLDCGAMSNGFYGYLLLGEERPNAAIGRASFAWNNRIYEELFAIGDDVWIVTDRNAVGAKICTIAKQKDPYFNGVMYTAEFFVNGERCSKRFVEEDIGESVFLTQEEAKEKCGC